MTCSKNRSISLFINFNISNAHLNWLSDFRSHTMGTKCKDTRRETEGEIVWGTTCTPASPTYDLPIRGNRHRWATHSSITTETAEPSKAECPGRKRSTERLKYLRIRRTTTEWVHVYFVHYFSYEQYANLQKISKISIAVF